MFTAVPTFIRHRLATRFCSSLRPLKYATASAATAALFATHTTTQSLANNKPVPDPDWKPGDGNLGRKPVTPAKDLVRVAPGELEKVCPTYQRSGSSSYRICEVNLAPFSFFGLMCHDPPTLVFCTTHKGGNPKDTLANVRATGECVVNIISEEFIEAANVCSGEYPPEVDEFELAGLTKVPSELLASGTPRVGEASVQMECKVVDIKDLVGREGKPTASMITCEIQAVFLDPSVHRKTARGSDVVDFEALKPVSRLGGSDYARGGDAFAMARPPADFHATHETSKN